MTNTNEYYWPRVQKRKPIKQSIMHACRGNFYKQSYDGIKLLGMKNVKNGVCGPYMNGEVVGRKIKEARLLMHTNFFYQNVESEMQPVTGQHTASWFVIVVITTEFMLKRAIPRALVFVIQIFHVFHCSNKKL